MTSEELETVWKAFQTKKDEGWHTLGEGGTMTLYVAHAGVSLTVPRIEAVRVEGEMVYARSPKKELFAFAKGDVFALAREGAPAGQPARRAGFG